MKPGLYLCAAAALAMVACERKPAEMQGDHGKASKLASEAAKDAFQRLSGELATAIADGGPPAAIAVCSEKAPGIISGTAKDRKVEMIRLSDRPRNPAHAASGKDLDAMQSFRAALKTAGGPKPVTHEEADGSVTVRLPITISQPLCLQCHGSENDISAETKAALLKIYPQDKATGYQLDDLRGIWRIRVPKDSAP
jgi:hypothetical protein